MNILKSKLIFILLFFSLSLNITHDFFMENQTFEKSPLNIQEPSTNSYQLTLCDLHHFFHFTATLQRDSEFIFPYLSYIQPLFYSPIPPTSSSSNTFRPPIS